MILRGPSVTRGVALFDIYESDQAHRAGFSSGLDEEKAIGVPVFTSYSASFTNLLSDIVDIVGGKDFENASKLLMHVHC